MELRRLIENYDDMIAKFILLCIFIFSSKQYGLVIGFTIILCILILMYEDFILFTNYDEDEPIEGFLSQSKHRKIHAKPTKKNGKYRRRFIKHIKKYHLKNGRKKLDKKIAKFENKINKLENKKKRIDKKINNFDKKIENITKDYDQHHELHGRDNIEFIQYDKKEFKKNIRNKRKSARRSRRRERRERRRRRRRN
jgi:hypothetical protein